ncbi:hypothetical protein HDU85_001942 [Gaertneriomyces sp. JEL0708]|nr:hypothetical protein HDU85_001942 [Gaertneriomyces sp. JEL0708]
MKAFLLVVAAAAVLGVHLNALLLCVGVLVGLLIADTVVGDGLRWGCQELQDAIARRNTRHRQAATSDMKGYTYGMHHALLNLRKPETLWLNMGYWKGTDDFVQACKALADLVQSPPLPPRAKAIDYGYGCGDQILHFLQAHPDSTIVGVTYEAEQARVAQARMDEINDNASSNYRSVGGTAKLFIGDATSSPKLWKPVLDSVQTDTDLEPGSFDIAYSLDSCYHYNTRTTWLKQCHRMLKAGGKLSMSDIILGERDASASSTLTLFVLRTILHFVGAPYGNIIPLEQYKESIQSCGFVVDDVQDISSDVFPGLGKFLVKHKADVGGIVDKSTWRRFEGAAKLFGWLHNKKLVRFVVVKATKRP